MFMRARLLAYTPRGAAHTRYARAAFAALCCATHGAMRDMIACDAAVICRYFRDLPCDVASASYFAFTLFFSLR